VKGGFAPIDLPSWILAIALSLGAHTAVAAPEPAPEPSDPPESGGAFDEPFFQLEDSEEQMGDLRPWTALGAIESGRFVRARELAESIVRGDPNSIEGQVLLGMVLHHGEGSLPRARYHLARGMELYEARFGRGRTEDPVWYWHALGLQDLASVSGEMERYDERLAYLDRLGELYDYDVTASRGWPLMRLKRLEEARVTAYLALTESDNLDAILTGWTALCAIESIDGKRAKSFAACMKAVELGKDESEYALYLTNAAEGALGVLRPDEAERLLLEATEHFTRPTLANPWMDLTNLYLSQGRALEALSALREMTNWRLRQPPQVDIQTWGETDLASALFLLAAGRATDAARLSSRTIEQPDRGGENSADFAQKRSAAELIHLMAERSAAQAEFETASWSEWGAALRAYARGIRHAYRSWASARRAAVFFRDDRQLAMRVQPYMGGLVKIPSWVEPELAHVLGPGPVEAAVHEGRLRETLPSARGFFDALDAEIAALRGENAQTLSRAELALTHLPESEILLRARIALLAAEAAADVEAQVRWYALVLQLDPGTVRRQAASLPVVIESSADAEAQRAADLLAGSPRLRARAAGFRVRVESDGPRLAACLRAPDGTLFGCGSAVAKPDDEEHALARRVAEDFHRNLFAPRIDLSQSDMNSLDGSNVAGGGRSAERMRIILDGLTR
jgi:hypothetical protein